MSTALQPKKAKKLEAEPVVVVSAEEMATLKTLKDKPKRATSAAKAAYADYQRTVKEG
jgi:hypothetical protein